MPTVIARPNLNTAIRTRLMSFPEIVTAVSTSDGYANDARPDQTANPRISSQILSYWVMPTKAIRLRRTGGSQGDRYDYTLGLWVSRVDVVCYGKYGHEPEDLINLVVPALCRPQGTDAGFTLRGCFVSHCKPETDYIVTNEPVTNYPFAWLPVLVLWRGAA